MRILKFGIFTAISILVCLFSVAAFPATETYTNACTNAYNNAASPSGWNASSSDIINIASGDPHDLRYDSSGNLIVRTATTASFYYNVWVGKAYTTYYDPTKQYQNASWVTTGNDFSNFYDTKGGGATGVDFTKAVERGLGMNNTASHTAIIEYSLDASNNVLMRPAKNPDIASYNPSQYGSSGSLSFRRPDTMTSDDAWTFLQNYYDFWKGDSAPAGAHPFPWTQLGYTYFWGNAENVPTKLSEVQGMTEFIIPENTSVNVYGIYSTQSYLYTKNNGQYGNGYASFNIYGPCNSLWAGHSFQYGVSRSASSPNEINLTNGGYVTGAEGILVWSLNYTVNVGSGCTVSSDGTSKKFGVTDSENIGILFEGDTTTDYGTPITVGINKVVNSGTITGNSSNTGTAVKTINGDTTVINNAGGTIIGATAIDCSNSTGTVSITNRGTISGPIALNAAAPVLFDVGNSALTVTNGSLSKLTVGANSATDYGVINTTGTTADASATVTLAPGGYIPNNTNMTVMTAGAGSISAVPGTISSTSPVFSVAGAVSSNNLVLTATRAHSYQSFASNANTSAAGSALNMLAMNNSAAGDMVTVLGALDSLTSGSQIDQALNSLLPNTDNSAPQTTQATLDQFISTVFAHLDAIKNVTTQALKGQDAWTSGYGSYIHQDPMGASNGYNATVWGTALGYDFPAMKDLRVGLSGGFAQDFIRTKDSSAKTDINSYQGALYGSYARDMYYIDTAFSFAYNTYDTDRHVAVGTVDRTAFGKYNGQQYSAYIGGGYKFTGKGLELTPLASFQYTHLRLNSYAETGAGGANLLVDAQDYNVAQTGLGMKLGYPLNLKGSAGRITPELKFKWLYDWVGDAQQATSTFTGGGGSFATQGFTPAQSSYDFGLKLILETNNFITVSLNYDLELKEDYYGHYGLAECRYRF